MFWERQFQSALGRMSQEVDAPVRLVLWDGSEYSFADAPAVTIRLKDTEAAHKFSNPDLLSLAEAYIDGHIELEGPISEVIRVAESIARTGKPGLLEGLREACSRHTRSIDRDSIRYHYDVSNDFYTLWLDRRMVYSCAYFRTHGDTLEQAQENKLDHICRKLRIKPGDRLLDIGCGWGALAMWAAEKYGADATGITLSENQHRLANERIASAGLQDRCRVVLQDYRDHEGEQRYDRIASVGMFEHVGLKNLPVYFATVARLLKERGTFLNHGITSMDVDNRWVGMRAGEFIDKYVFPNGELPHLSVAVREMSAHQLEVADVEGLRPHYAKTLQHWSDRYEGHLRRAAEASDERTARIWRVYLAGCAHAFEQGWVSIYQVLATKQSTPGRGPLPLTREYMYAH